MFASLFCSYATSAIVLCIRVFREGWYWCGRSGLSLWVSGELWQATVPDFSHPSLCPSGSIGTTHLSALSLAITWGCWWNLCSAQRQNWRNDLGKLPGCRLLPVLLWALRFFQQLPESLPGPFLMLTPAEHQSRGLRKGAQKQDGAEGLPWAFISWSFTLEKRRLWGNLRAASSA